MGKHTILKQVSAAALGLLLSASSWSAEINSEFTRAFSGEGDQRIQLVFEITGSGTDEYTVFAQGPSLTSAGVSGAMADPQINLLQNNVSIASNNDWRTDSSAGRVSEVAAFYGIALNSRDAAMVRTLGAGLYTVVVTGADGGTGIVRVGAADSSDIPSAGLPPPDVSDVCSRELCATSAAAAQQCQDFLDSCLLVEDEDECVGGALLICGTL